MEIAGVVAYFFNPSSGEAEVGLRLAWSESRFQESQSHLDCVC